MQEETIKQLQAENERLRASLANIAGDNLCHLDGNDGDGKIPIPPWPEFSESCRRHHAQISGTAGELTGCMTIAQLELECNRLRTELLTALCKRTFADCRAGELERYLRNAVAMLNAAIRICRTSRELWPDMQVDTSIGLWTEQVKASMALIADAPDPENIRS